ncbi:MULTISPECIES: CerR family C-terminal domain-containing protein [Paraburkholderia]|uniref:CerR family C-terminal domain-containing protein n=1 Tax=Paraburkholderia TaxID=1822464 RepID=UPI002259F66F|nr:MULTISPECIES: CerR family C-terminal domain-containing protein [Paraburkholderia]MCX4161864.1 CerR family C-terminal domain-containing protein [Paraburkholderia megapolitana]MDN7157361.1 CerR family C-terminal domain-containing protein [Paraburkholderia sp. CHISQ3]MDQ6494406.1 CerR family C-terminal domain-containing protein [Paraburkholderia megapolitana]
MNDIKKLRRPQEGGYARGDETRRRIIDAAVDLFGEKGFDGASTRDIAALAGVNAPALQYYFENKEGVYRACIEALADDAWEIFGPAIENAHEVLSNDDADTDELIEAFIRIQEATADSICVKATVPGRRLFFAREQSGSEPASATEILMNRVRKPFNAAAAALVARISGRAVDDPITLIRMFSLHGQMVIFHVAHRTTLTLLNWETFDADNAAVLKATVADQTRMLLRQWSLERALHEGEAKRKPAAKRRAGSAARKKTEA